MIVDQVGPEARDWSGGDNLDVGVLRVDGLRHVSKAAVVTAGSGEPVLVADLDVVQRKRLGKPVGGATLAPFARCRTADVLDLLQRLLRVLPHLRASRI